MADGYGAQVLNFKFSESSLWITGVDYRKGKKDCFDAMLFTSSEGVDDEAVISLLLQDKCVLRVKYCNSASPLYFAGNNMSACIKKVFGSINLDLRSKELKPCLISNCYGGVDPFEVRRANGGALFENQHRRWEGCHDDRYILIPCECSTGSELYWDYNGSLGYSSRYGWYNDNKSGFLVLFLSSGGCKNDDVRHDVRIVMTDTCAICVEDDTVLHYLRLENAPVKKSYNCQIFEADYDPYKLNVIDYEKGTCRPVHIHEHDNGIISVRIHGVGENSGQSVTEALNNLLGSVNMWKEEIDELMPGLPQNKFNGADEGLFGFLTLGQSGYQVIECKWLSGRANRYVVMNPKQTRWSSDRFQSEYNEASYGYNKSAGGYILWLLLGGGFETKVRFYDGYAEGSDLVDRFRLEYKTLEQILREVVFSAEV